MNRFLDRLMQSAHQRSHDREATYNESAKRTASALIEDLYMMFEEGVVKPSDLPPMLRKKLEAMGEMSEQFIEFDLPMNDDLIKINIDPGYDH